MHGAVGARSNANISVCAIVRLPGISVCPDGSEWPPHHPPSPAIMLRFASFLFLLCAIVLATGFLPRSQPRRLHSVYKATVEIESVFEREDSVDVEILKRQILQLGAALDRGQMYNPTSGAQYSEPMDMARGIVSRLANTQATKTWSSVEQLDGEWELVFSTVPHGIFRSSPFFLAIQDAYAAGGDASKANLFFKLHELQTCSWGVSKIGRVAQVINAKSNLFISEFDTTIFSLTVIPFFGWGKLLPSFGGCVITVSKILGMESDGKLSLEVDYTTAKKVPGLNSLPGNIGVGVKVPVGAVWKLLPWNKGRSCTASLYARFVDKDFRIMQDQDGEYFVYTRPVFSRLEDLNIEY